MIRANLKRLMASGHIVAINPHHCRFGDTFQPECIEDDCYYVGPFVSEPRAYEIADEHRRKSAGIWKAAK